MKDLFSAEPIKFHLVLGDRQNRFSPVVSENIVAFEYFLGCRFGNAEESAYLFPPAAINAFMVQHGDDISF
jgi:hypothetical protein